MIRLERAGVLMLFALANAAVTGMPVTGERDGF